MREKFGENVSAEDQTGHEKHDVSDTQPNTSRLNFYFLLAIH